MKRSRAAIGTALVTSTLTSLALLSAAPAATAAVQSEPLATGLAGPLQMDLERQGDNTRIVVAQSFAGLLTEVTDSGTDVLHSEDGFEIAGVAIDGSDVAFLTTKNPPEDPEAPFRPQAFLKLLTKDGVTEVANLRRYERQENPDADVRYGFGGLTDNCEGKLPEFAQSHEGFVDAHPYGLAEAPNGGWYVADAAGNSILKVRRNGTVKTVAVLPAQRVRITKARAQALELPGCVVGRKFRTEAVPTDVEVAKNGSLVVSLLPGGPEEEALGARGKVVRVDPTTGKSTKIAKGFLGATNVAIGNDGVIYVSELMGGKISAIDGDAVSTYHQAPPPAALEWANGTLYATIDVFNMDQGGKLVTLTPTSAED